MATRKRTGRPLGRPIDPQKQAAILEAGWNMFLERGVEAVSLEADAAKAGVSKATLYRHFPDKSALFEAGVLLEMERIEAAQNVKPGGTPLTADLASVLHEFGM